MKDEIKIITLDDIFENIETEEKAIRFKNYIKDLQKENQRLNNVLNELEKWLEEDDEVSDISFEMGRHFNYKDVINKIYELKESDK